MADREYFNQRRKNRREKFINLLGGKCERCGTTENLQFDHKNPKKKEFRIADKIDAPEEILLKEVKKCILLCNTCHRDKTREKGEHGQPKARHGTLHMYKRYGCRCKKCKQRMSEYNMQRREKINRLAAKYQGKEVKLNDPIRNPSDSSKKFTVEDLVELFHKQAEDFSIDESVNNTINIMGEIQEAARLESSEQVAALLSAIARDIDKASKSGDFSDAFDRVSLLGKLIPKGSHKLIITLARHIADIRNNTHSA